MIASKLLVAGVALATSIAMSGAVQAAPQDNQCWGQIASGLAKYDSVTQDNTLVEEKGGSMGLHSRSTQAATNNGGFASPDNGFGITFNVEGGRQGVGNVSKGAPHNTAPADGGNGQHAVNNGEALALVLDPTTGQFFTGDDVPTAINCDLDVEPNLAPPG
jgi:hypothetical protein